jgi:hypothetical protein
VETGLDFHYELWFLFNFCKSALIKYRKILLERKINKYIYSYALILIFS